ncbi:hypothetical protein [Streptomyces sp. NPDC017993]|uniref:hypothetical protein n=1 Tax=Streptomyces sp. NPDC017993 TaxID=3365027 RepID=UPI0037BDDB02
MRLTHEQADGIRTVETRYPTELASQMPAHQPPAVRNAILATLGQGPRQRTAQQLADRLERRWHSWGFADKRRSGEIGSDPGVVICLLTRHVCAYDRCEDGTDIDTGQPCKVCPDRERLRRERNKPLPHHPEQHDSQRPTQTWWECSTPECRQPGKGTPPADGLCAPCRTQAEAAATAAEQLTAHLTQQETTQQLQAEQDRSQLLEAAYTEHGERAKEAEPCTSAEEAERHRNEDAEKQRLREHLAQEHPELVQFRQPSKPPF